MRRSLPTVLSVILPGLAALICAEATLSVWGDDNSNGKSRDAQASPTWWSLQPLGDFTPPELADTHGLRNPIDAFVLEKLNEKGMQPAPRADRITLLRRAKFDLVGLPLTAEEIDQFTLDDTPDWYERWIERLLSSPHYGERWGRHWLDVVRFGESDGFENDKLRDYAWHYRDYVIRSLNSDKPYDRFVTEQLAGDVLEPITRDGVVATGFLVAGPWDEIQFVAKSPTERLRAREEQQEELIAAIGQSFLGLTVHCARCHDHKFDPIPQADYYALKAVFDGIDHRTGEPRIDAADRGNRPLLTPAEQKTYTETIAPIQARIRELSKSLSELHNRLGSDATVQAQDGTCALADGRFSRALNARVGHAISTGKSAYHTSPFTVECWANLTSKGSFNVLVANQAKESSEHWEIYTYAGTGEFSAYLPGYEPAEIKSGVDITDGLWHYLAMTLDGERVTLLVDAKPVLQASVKRVKNEMIPGSLWFGAYPPQRIGCDGAVDDVRLSNIVRVIEAVPNGPFEVDANTVGLWHMDELAGQKLADTSQSIDESLREQIRAEELAITAQSKAAERALAALAPALTYVGVRLSPPATRLFYRGDINKPGPEVKAASLSALRTACGDGFELAPDAPESERRLSWARWVASPHNPLFARVMVNRIWHYHFGSAFVDTPSDFGVNGGQPSHPELLDWLAREFVASGFGIKHMHRLIMLSATYQQSSYWHERWAQIDSDNRWYWRFTARRLEAEAIRDAMLAVSGEMNPQIGGPSFRPFTTTALLTQFYHRIDDDRPDFNRRTIYRINVNTAKDPLLDSLDCPAPSVSAPRRRSTTTTLQALSLMNDSFVQRQAERFAARVCHMAGSNVFDQVRLGFRIALNRDPTEAELAKTLSIASAHGLENVCWALLNSSEFIQLR